MHPFDCFHLLKQGKINHEKLDSLNMQIYLASPEELEAVVKRNGCFSIEMMESQDQEKPQPKEFSSTIRGGTGGIIKEYFGLEEETLDELFDLLQKKLEEHWSIIFESGNMINLFVLLKRIIQK